jgi:hypothetical protein
VITQDEAAAALMNVASNLRYILDDVGVRMPIQEMVYQQGFNTMAHFLPKIGKILCQIGKFGAAKTLAGNPRYVFLAVSTCPLIL